MSAIRVLSLVVLAALAACSSDPSAEPTTTIAEASEAVAVTTPTTQPTTGSPNCSQGTELQSGAIQSPDEVRVLETPDHQYLCLVGSDAETVTIGLTELSVAAPEEVSYGPLPNSWWYHLFALPNGFPDVDVFDETGIPLKAVRSSGLSHLVIIDHTVAGSTPDPLVVRRWSAVGADGSQVAQLQVQSSPLASVTAGATGPLSPTDPLPIVSCLRNEGLNVADPPSVGPDGVVTPATVPAGSPPRDVQPFAPDRARAAWAKCRHFQIAALTGPGTTPEQADATMTFLDCMADQGWIQAFAASDAGTEAHNIAMTACGHGRPVEQIPMTCDAYLVDDVGVIASEPVRAGGTGFFTVALASLPNPITVGDRFTVQVPSVSLPLASGVENFIVVSFSDFVRVFQVTGALIIPDSVITLSSVPQPPFDPADVGASTVALRFLVEVAGGGNVAFPAANFDAVAGDVGTSIEVSLIRFETTLVLQSADETTSSVRSVCTPEANVLGSTTVTG